MLADGELSGAGGQRDRAGTEGAPERDGAGSGGLGVLDRPAGVPESHIDGGRAVESDESLRLRDDLWRFERAPVLPVGRREFEPPLERLGRRLRIAGDDPFTIADCAGADFA